MVRKNGWIEKLKALNVGASNMRNVLSNFSVYWGIIVGAFIGGAWLIWQISEWLSSKVSLILIDDPKGFVISTPKSINAGLIFFVLLVILVLLIAIVALIKEIKKANPALETLAQLRETLVQLRAQYYDIVGFAKNITQNFYDETDNLKRIDPTKITIVNDIDVDGSTKSTRTYEIRCGAKPAHMFDIWIEADDESPGILGHRALRFSAKDLTRNRAMDWMPTHDTLRKKHISIFFSEMQPGETKTIKIEHY